ncbi:flagellar basal body rod protein FlgG [Lentibacillus lipolyticus]|nr:flagellar basal body rod protein FlgG [Lentibacillus lipolyticus]
MLRSMYSGISGMKGFQTKLDVIGNNISNVNTTGFKKGRVTFQDLMSQMSSGAQGATDTRGGVNPSMVGLGSQTGSIDDLHTQGFRQTTNNPLDFALEGDGMFAVASDLADENNNPVDNPSEDSVDMGASNVSYTRAGNFYLDEDGNIVNPDGLYLMGYSVEAEDGNYEIDDSTINAINIPETAQSFSVQTNGTVNYVDSEGNTQVAGQILLANFSNPAGLEKVGNNLYLDTENAGYNGLSKPDSDGVATVVSGALEMSNVDLSSEFTEMITAQRGFQANTRIITTSDEILQELVNLKR